LVTGSAFRFVGGWIVFRRFRRITACLVATFLLIPAFVRVSPLICRVFLICRAFLFARAFRRRRTVLPRAIGSLSSLLRILTQMFQYPIKRVRVIASISR
jgi:hypothetical protein